MLTSVHDLNPPDQLYRVSKGSVEFVSDAPLEIIKAKTSMLKGILNTENNTFAFKIAINTFNGFNSRLQEEHFHESYMETTRYPEAVFKGKIIELIDYGSEGIYSVRSKGVLILHGVSVEKIIRCKIRIMNNNIQVESEFELELEDYNIKIPKIVNQKIASTINVTVKATFQNN
jgi:YceI-like protein